MNQNQTGLRTSSLHPRHTFPQGIATGSFGTVNSTPADVNVLVWPHAVSDNILCIRASSQTTAAYEPEGHPNPFLQSQNDDLPNFLDRFDTQRLFLRVSVPRSGPVWETLNDQIVAQLTSSGLHLPPPPNSLNIHAPVPFHQLDWQLLGPTTRS